jgi:hypothetical protein
MPQVLHWKPEVCGEILEKIIMIDLCVVGTALYVPLGMCSRGQMEIGREMTVERELSAEG